MGNQNINIVFPFSLLGKYNDFNNKYCNVLRQGGMNGRLILYQMVIGGKRNLSLMVCLPPTVQVIMSMWIIISQHSTNHLGGQNIQKPLVLLVSKS